MGQDNPEDIVEKKKRLQKKFASENPESTAVPLNRTENNGEATVKGLPEKFLSGKTKQEDTPGTSVEQSSDEEYISVGAPTRLRSEYLEEVNKALSAVGNSGHAQRLQPFLKNEELDTTNPVSRYEQKSVRDDGKPTDLGTYAFKSIMNASTELREMEVLDTPGMDEENIAEEYLELTGDLCQSLSTNKGDDKWLQAYNIIANESDISQSELANELGVDQGSVSIKTDEWEDYGLIEKGYGNIDMTRAGETVNDHLVEGLYDQVFFDNDHYR